MAVPFYYESDEPTDIWCLGYRDGVIAGRKDSEQVNASEITNSVALRYVSGRFLTEHLRVRAEFFQGQSEIYRKGFEIGYVFGFDQAIEDKPECKYSMSLGEDFVLMAHRRICKDAKDIYGKDVRYLLGKAVKKFSKTEI